MLFKLEVQAHRLIGVSSRREHGSHHVDPAKHELTAVKSRATVGSLQVVSRDERVQKPSNKNAKPVASDSNFEQNIVENRRKDSKRVGHRLQCRMQSSPS